MNKAFPFASFNAVDLNAPLNCRELTSVNALLAYAAYEHKINEEALRDSLARRFGVADVPSLPGKSYDEVVRFLVDLQADMILN